MHVIVNNCDQYNTRPSMNNAYLYYSYVMCLFTQFVNCKCENPIFIRCGQILCANTWMNNLITVLVLERDKLYMKTS